ncbi:helix-turn-helix domain-containing protein [Bosea sp. (in: a-proteobacteria)]|uniref:helix-turn-helix domain-containing protein n=1 Tax=Bosea sp. (in: a-proteobacteria) TaxID=1871050 RepID=UPI001AC584E8|nr:helix-turn-helix domain-containing protein [Bosea sp. (in: a-proteobacteria)]MBN9438954.1 hypothetical protein [Bosea sp. (in: a-proteobacteria)]
MSDRLVRLDMIISVVEVTAGLTRRAILADRRDSDHVRARFAIYWLAKQLTLFSLPEIGDRLGRDHSSVHHGISRCEELRAADPDFRATTDAMLLILQAADRAGHIRIAAATDPIAAARRVLARPEREAVRVSTAEIIAMARELVALHGPDDEPTPSPISKELEDAA